MHKFWGQVLLFLHGINKYLLFFSSIAHLPIPDFILKLYTFNILLFELFPLQRTNWFPFNARATERIKNLSIIFLIFIDN
jgi:hypothetical protein